MRAIHLTACIAILSLTYIGQASRCPFHRKAASSRDSLHGHSSADASPKRKTLESDESSPDVKSMEATDKKENTFLSQLLLWLSEKFGWRSQESVEQRWDYSRLIELESNWSELKPWKTKLNLIWDEITSSPSLSNHYPSLSEFFFRLILVGDDFSRLRLPLTFRPYANTQKVLHAGGSYGRVLFRWTDVKFRQQHTGLFSEPVAEAIMSASAGNPFVGNQSAAFGWGFKFMRSNVAPASILTLNAFLGRGAYWNVFGFMTCNHASVAEMAALIATVIGWSNFPNQNGLSNMARFKLNGEETRDPNFPYSLCFIPNPLLTQRIGDPTTLSSLSSVHSQFRLVEPEEHLFDIVAIFHPKVLVEPDLLLNPTYASRVGEVIALSKFTRSQFGDSRLFFQHQPFDDDLLIKPEWVPYMTLNNMIREGALGAYRHIYTPPKPQLSNQIIALKSLARFFIRLLTRPGSGPFADLGVVGTPNIFELLLSYVRQGGSTTPKIILRSPFPRAADGTAVHTDLEASSELAKDGDTDQEHPDIIMMNGTLINGTSEEQRLKFLHKWLTDSLKDEDVDDDGGTFASGTAAIGYSGHRDHYLTQNQWPSSTPNSMTDNSDDPFMESWQRSILLSDYLKKLYIQKQQKRPTGHTNWISQLFIPNLILPTWLSTALNYGTETFSDLRNSATNIATLPNSASLAVLLRPFIFLRDRTWGAKDIVENEELAAPILEKQNREHTIDASSDKIKPKEESADLLKNSPPESSQPPSINQNSTDSLFKDPQYRRLLQLDETIIFKFLRDVANILTSPLHSPLNLLQAQFDPKLVVIHLIAPVFWTAVRPTETRDAAFERLMSAVLGLGPHP